jgi:hypothetical protein
MSPFGPFYPPRLQASINHAERLVTVLAREEQAQAHRPPPAGAWLIGRAGELEQFAEAIAGDWRTRRRSEAATASALEAYLAELHDSMAARLGMTEPSCCRGASTATESAPEPPDPQQGLLDSIDRLLSNLGGPAGGASG